MKFDRLIVRAPWADEDFIATLAARPGIDGVVLGDPFLPGGASGDDLQVLDLMQRARDGGLYVSLQTPVYVTGRNFDRVMSLVSYVLRHGLADDLRIQDVGLLSRLGRKKPGGVSLTWSIYGYQREFPGMDVPFGQDQLDFLTGLGVDSFEITSAVAFSIRQNRYPIHFPMQVYLSRYEPVSFSRVSYTAGLPAGERSPANAPAFRLVDEDGMGIEYAVDGHRILEETDPGETRQLLQSPGHALFAVLEEPAGPEELLEAADRLARMKTGKD